VRPFRPGALSAALMLAAAASASAAEPRGPRVRLPLEYEDFSYLSGRPGPEVDSRHALTAIPDVEWAPDANLFLRFALALRKDFSDDERSRIYPHEGFLDLLRDPWALRIGRQFITWGRADTLRPTDVFRRRDLTDLVEDRVEAIDALKLNFLSGSWGLEGVWVPVFEPDILSFRAENRWTLFPTEGQVSFREGRREEPPRTPESGEAGIRLTRSARGWDFAAMYYYGYDRTPTFVRQRLVEFDPITGAATIRLVPVHRRIHVVGGDFATVVNGWDLRGEAAYTLTTDSGARNPEVDDPYLRFTGGVGRTTRTTPVGESLSVILQYALDEEVPQRGAANQEEFAGLRHFYRHAVAVNATWKYSEFLRLNGKGFVNLEDFDFALQTELSWQPIDAMTLAVGADFFGGRRNTFFGQFRDNDRVRVKVSYTF
jgi:uncharacterized protein DUF1302